MILIGYALSTALIHGNISQIISHKNQSVIRVSFNLAFIFIGPLSLYSPEAFLTGTQLYLSSKLIPTAYLNVLFSEKISLRKTKHIVGVDKFQL